ncbi:MAG: hypothetical protein HC904_13250 [Blastochloris sp.]|nr:hypothetical protein [Blastochloris sp.]
MVGLPMRRVGQHLASWLESAREHWAGREESVRLVLASESEGEDAEEAAALVKAALPGLSLGWLGAEERRVYAKELAKEAGLESGLLEEALYPAGEGLKTGALRNALMLEAVGETFLMSDDDARWNLRRALGTEERVDVGSFASQGWHYDWLEGESWGVEEEGNVFECHVAFLGKSLAGLLQERGGGSLLGLDTTLQATLRNPSARVGISVLDIVEIRLRVGPGLS